MRKSLVLTVVFALVALSAFAELPDVFGEPGEVVELEEFFVPDPYEVFTAAGGNLYFDAEADLGDDYFRRDDEAIVAGFVNGSGPDISFYYDTSGTADLYFAFLPDDFADTFLLINDPDGDWWVVDDSDDSLDPYFSIENPPAGRYDIWIGNWDEEIVPGTFYISELEDMGF